jgi:uncharacterized protein YndB with AHSA1/START domain
MNLPTEISVDRVTTTIHIRREFAADLDLVWDAWTKAELLDQWMGPKPIRAQTKEMDFREGGRWLYAMISPENVARWGLVQFVEIRPKSSFSSRNSFCDENGNPLQTGFVSSLTTNTFEAGQGRTTVHVAKQMGSLAEIEKFLAMGFKEGFTLVMSNLEELLQARMAGDR